MCVVNVAHLEASAFTRETTGTKSGKTALVSHLSKRVGLVHELRQRVGAEERAYNARDGLGVDKVGGLEHFVVANVHALANGAAHTGKTDGELIAQLLADSAHTTVGKVVDVIHCRIGIDKLDEIFYDGNDIIFGEDAHLIADIKS